MNGNVKKGKRKIGIAFLLAVLVPVPMVGAQAEAGIGGLKGTNLFMLIGYEGMNTFTMLSRITLALSFLVAITGFAYFILKRRKKEIKAKIKEAKEWRGREEEIMEIIKEVKELKKRMEEKGVEFVFGLSVVVALCLAMISMLK